VAADVAAALDLRPVGDQVVVHLAVRAEAPAEHPAAHLVVRDLQVDDGVDVVALHEELGLPGVARETVDHEAEIPVVLLQPVAHHGLDRVVADELAGVHHAADLRAELRVVLNVPAEQVADADVHHVQLGAEQLALGALAAALHAHDHVLAHYAAPIRRGPGASPASVVGSMLQAPATRRTSCSPTSTVVSSSAGSMVSGRFSSGDGSPNHDVTWPV
jgi:hypothetical protein